MADVVACVIVHHNSCETLMRTVDLIVAAGIVPTRLVVIDNSEDELQAVAIRRQLPRGVVLITSKNDGYAAAVNRGADFLYDTCDPEFVLVSTHEVQPRSDSVDELLNAINTDDSIAVVGPTLADSNDLLDDSAPVWSTGGSLSRSLRLPAHTGAGKSLRQVVEKSSQAVAPRDRQWLDGAFCLYRSTGLKIGMREDFFLYTEELEFHTRLRSLGHRVVWAPKSIATQQTNGTPSYYQARNTQIFLRLWGNRFQQVVSVPYLIARSWVARTLHRSPGRSSSLRAAVRGLRDGWAHELR